MLFADRKAFDRHLVPYEGRCDLQLVVRRKTKPRSRQEEKYFHAVVLTMIADALSCTLDEAKEIVREIHCREEVRHVLPDKRVIRYERLRSTTEYSDTEYRELWERVVAWAALPTKDKGLAHDSGLELYIPYPNEADWDGRDEYMG